MNRVTGNGSNALVLGIGIAVAMWWTAYLLHLPVHEIESTPGPAATAPADPASASEASPPAGDVDPMADRPAARPGDSVHRFGGQPNPRWVVAIMALLMIAGGFVAGPYGWRVAIGAGLICGVLNLFALGSALSDAHRSSSPNAVVPSAPLWVGGYLVLAVGLFGLGALLRSRRRSESPSSPRSLGAPDLAFLLAAATFLLIIIGGLVTSEEAGMAVEDWPTTQGSNMFLYPLAKMTGGVFLEHSHRLFGSFVGLITLILAVYLFVVDRRGWARGGGIAILIAVILQGLAGGYRVVLDAEWGTAFRILHGVLGQLFFAAVIAFGVALRRSRTPLAADGPVATERARHLMIHRWFLLCVVVQLVLGAVTRHGFRDPFVYLHLMFAIVVIGLGHAASVRLAFREEAGPALRFGARVIAIALGLQLVLGFAAFIVTAPDQLSWTATLVATAHQAVGAAVLGAAVWQVAWLTPTRATTTARASEGASAPVPATAGTAHR